MSLIPTRYSSIICGNTSTDVDSVDQVASSHIRRFICVLTGVLPESTIGRQKLTSEEYKICESLVEGVSGFITMYIPAFASSVCDFIVDRIATITVTLIISFAFENCNCVEIVWSLRTKL